MEITAAQVKALRDATGAGMMDCRNALREAGGDLDKATQLLRERGKAGVEKRAGRSTTQGVVDAYLHTPDPNLPPKLGVLVELDCETDFVAATDEFQRLAHEIALHIAVADPSYIRREEVPADVLAEERAISAKQAEGATQADGEAQPEAAAQPEETPAEASEEAADPTNPRRSPRV